MKQVPEAQAEALAAAAPSNDSPFDFDDAADRRVMRAELKEDEGERRHYGNY
ncbi:MAG: hypothetical protein ABJF23_30375 [Bryobacteraceae bacterium]